MSREEFKKVGEGYVNGENSLDGMYRMCVKVKNG